MVSKEILEKFKILYQEKFKVSVSEEEATQMATDLVNLMRVLLEPEPKKTDTNSQSEERRQDETLTTPSS